MSINGRCVAKGMHFKSASIVGLFDWGNYDVTIHPSDGRCSKRGIGNTRIVIPENSLSVHPTRTVVLSSQSGNAKLTVLHNEADSPQLLVYNLVEESFALNLAATNVDGTQYTRGASVSPGTLYSASLQQDRLKQYSITAVDSAGRSLSFQASPQTSRTNVVYIVGSKKNGYVGIRDVFSRHIWFRPITNQ
jgi:hypothetical protein